MSMMFGSRGIEIMKGSGAQVTDSSGRSYIDFSCGNGSSLFGHNHPVLVKALKEASEFPWSVGIGFRSSRRELFIKKLRALMPEGKVFLCNSGTEAIEAALKLAFVFKPKRKKIVALRRSFHGRTLGSLSLTFNPQYKKYWKGMLLDVVHVSPDDVPGVVDSDTAAVFVEPVQGEGGVHVMDPSTGRTISECCRRNGALLVCDEIQSGWGRCGAILSSYSAGLEPDIACLAKGVAGGLPVGVTIWNGAHGDFPVKGHGTTYGGNPLVCSVGLAALELLRNFNYPEEALKKGEYFRKCISRIDSPHIKEIRGLGLLSGIELDIKALEVVKKLEERGILALNAGPMVLRFLPPLVVTNEQLDKTVAGLEAVLSEMQDG